MTAIIKQRFHLTGPLAGRTITLGSLPYRFASGVMELAGTPLDLTLHARMLERNWQAYPEGHPALEAQPAQEKTDGQRDISKDPAPGSDGSAVLQGGSEPDGQGAPAGDPAPDGGEPAAPQTGETGSLPNGVGRSESVAVPDSKLRRAVLGLDPADDQQWTKDGKPAMAAVEKLYGATDITRADVEAAFPGYDRAAALKAKTEQAE